MNRPVFTKKERMEPLLPRGLVDSDAFALAGEALRHNVGNLWKTSG